jgi:transposase
LPANWAELGFVAAIPSLLISGDRFWSQDILMPHKLNEARRHKIAKQKFKVTNWSAYNESLRRRGDLTVWVSDEALGQWSASRRTSRGGQPKYSDLAVTMCLTLRVVYDLPLRQTQGLMRSIAKLMGVEIAVPDFSTLSRRGKGLALPSIRYRSASRAPVHLVVDSTGLKVFGEGERLENKHNIKVKRKRWRKLHIGLDLVSGEIICSNLTTDDVGDPTALADLLDQIDGPVARFLADGAYDGSPTRDLLADRLGEIVEVIIPPPKTAVQSPQSALDPSIRDRHIAEIETNGRMAWQKSTGYNQRSRVETQMGRWKTVIGPKLKARNFDNQTTEAKIGVRVLNRMTELGRPEFTRVA